MIYGAYGYTGTLIAEGAIRRGHRPLLSGRSMEKLAAIADQLGLEQIPIDLEDENQLHNALEGVNLVLNAAGPFVHTAGRLVDACLKTGTSYMDISGEPLVMEKVFAQEDMVQERGIAFIPGVGFNVLASDCLARYVADTVERPLQLEIATRWLTEGTSPGSMATMIETIPIGTLARRNGQLVSIGPREGMRRQRFLGGTSTIVPVPLGDLATAYRTCGISNITTYTAIPDETARSYRLSQPLLRLLFSVPRFRRMAIQRARRSSSGSQKLPSGGEKAQVWASVRNAEGVERQAWLETVDSYPFTAGAAVRSVEKLLADPQVGVLTPALAFGADFVLEIPGTRRRDHLQEEGDVAKSI